MSAEASNKLEPLDAAVNTTHRQMRELTRVMTTLRHKLRTDTKMHFLDTYRAAMQVRFQTAVVRECLRC